MNINKRHRNRWTINETLSLQREYELLEWSVYTIAEKHERTVMAIMSKLQKEEIIDSWNEARGFNIEEYQEDCYVPQTETNYDDEEEEDEEEDEDEEDYTIYVYDGENDREAEIENNVKHIMNRLWSLQTSMVKQIFNIFTAKPKKEQKSVAI